MYKFLSKLKYFFIFYYFRLLRKIFINDYYFIFENLNISKDQKVVVYSSYYHGNAPNYVIELIQSFLCNNWAVILVLTGSNLGLEKLIKSKSANIVVINRKNLGLDFASYAIGLEFIDKKIYSPCKTLLLNDSIIVMNPEKFVVSLEREFLKIKEQELISITESYQILYHLQSYCMGFIYDTEFSNLFKLFFSDFILLPPKYKNYFIEKGELRFSQFFLKHGYHLKAILGKNWIMQKDKNIDLLDINPTHELWYLFINQNLEFVKKDIFRDPSYLHILEQIKKNDRISSNSYIKEHFN